MTRTKILNLLLLFDIRIKNILPLIMFRKLTVRSIDKYQDKLTLDKNKNQYFSLYFRKCCIFFLLLRINSNFATVIFY